MTGQSVVSTCNIALLSIGARAQISSLTEGSTQSDACSTLFQFVYEQLARTAYWNCLRDQRGLSLLAAAAGTPENPNGTTLPIPPTPWLYQYQVPSNCLAARYIVPSIPMQGSNPISPAMIPAVTWVPTQEQIPFHVAYGTDSNNNPLQVILTNQSQAELVYTVNQPNPSIWDASFQAAYVASLGAWLVPALALNIKLAQLQMAIADKLIADARARDANEGSTIQDHIPDWMRARNTGGGYGDSGFGYAGGFDAMGWPV